MRCQRLVTEDRPGDLRQPVRDGDERLPRSAKRGRPVAFVEIAGFRLPIPARIGFPEHGTHGVSPVFRRSEEHTSELQSLMRNTYAVFCWKKKKKIDEKN